MWTCYLRQQIFLFFLVYGFEVSINQLYGSTDAQAQAKQEGMKILAQGKKRRELLMLPLNDNSLKSLLEFGARNKLCPKSDESLVLRLDACRLFLASRLLSDCASKNQINEPKEMTQPR